jgi:hypothetical protein
MIAGPDSLHDTSDTSHVISRQDVISLSEQAMNETESDSITGKINLAISLAFSSLETLERCFSDDSDSVRYLCHS